MNLTAEEIVEYWYDEHRKYEYETPGWQAGTNYFTQIIWYSTQEVSFKKTLFNFNLMIINFNFVYFVKFNINIKIH